MGGCEGVRALVGSVFLVIQQEVQLPGFSSSLTVWPPRGGEEGGTSLSVPWSSQLKLSFHFPPLFFPLPPPSFSLLSPSSLLPPPSFSLLPTPRATSGHSSPLPLPLSLSGQCSGGRQCSPHGATCHLPLQLLPYAHLCHPGEP